MVIIFKTSLLLPIASLFRPVSNNNLFQVLSRSSNQNLRLLSKFRMASTLKRKEAPSTGRSSSKKAKIEVPEYHLTTSLRDENDNIIWPAPKVQIQNARKTIRESAQPNNRILIVPDKDADGLTSGCILRRTLILLGASADNIAVHLISKGNTIHTDVERDKMASHNPSYVFVLDQGSRSGPPVIDSPHTALIIDHHHAEDGSFPNGAQFVTACHSPPVATASLLTYTLCAELHPVVKEQCAWLCIIGTHGDLGTTIKWLPPFPDMTDTFKRYSKKALNDCVSALNAPRRTATYDVISAWNALVDATKPEDVLQVKRLHLARDEVFAETERCTHTPPKFSYDGKVAVLRISSGAQVHPVIATRWAGHLNSKKLEVVLVANSGYLPGYVNFSCRIPRCARSRDPPVNLIESLKSFADLAEDPTLRERLGDAFARGHKEASGGIVPVEEFEELMRALRVGEKPEKQESPKKAKEKSPQKNTLANYFSKKD